MSGPHLQVADRAMCFFENDQFLNILKNFKKITFPMLVPVISVVANNHWHKYFFYFLEFYKKVLSH
jgi:serine/threonine-protein phosphatase 2A regulatory subunit B'